MARLRTETVKRDLRVQAKSFCVFAEACPHIGHLECTKCLRYFVDLEDCKIE